MAGAKEVHGRSYFPSFVWSPGLPACAALVSSLRSDLYVTLSSWLSCCCCLVGFAVAFSVSLIPSREVWSAYALVRLQPKNSASPSC